MPYPRIGAGRHTFILAESFNIAELTVQWRDQHGKEYYRVPREKILEAIALYHIWTPDDATNEPCVPMTHRDFDRYEGGFWDIGLNLSDHALRSVQRKVLRVTQDGRKILMNTNTSAYDFSLGRVPRTPGWIP
jgi:hypothetical protein